MIAAVLALLLGGILKGATGAGAPIIGIPILAMQYDVPFAVAIFLLPNLIPNIWQGWAYRAHWPSVSFVATFAVAGTLGAGLGAVMLATLPSDLLLLMVALVVLAYIAFRLMRPDWRLRFPLAYWLSIPAGFFGGLMQGAAGISAPISITFLNALRLERAQFIGTISIFFLAMSLSQLPTMVAFGLMTWERAALSLAAVVPLMAAMPVGSWLARKFSSTTFDRITLALLGVIAVKLLIDVAL